MIPGAYPFGQEPLSSLAASEDTSHGSPIVALLSDERAELQFAMRTYGYNPATGELETVVFSSAGYSSMGDGEGDSDGIDDHLHFPAALVSPYSVKVNLISGGAWQASAIPGFGAVVIADPSGEFDYLKGWDFEGQRLTVWIGRRQWIGPSWSEFGRVFHGTIAALSWDLGTTTLDIRDLREVLDVDANPDEYLGFGSAVRFTTAGQKVTVPYDGAMVTSYGLSVFYEVEVMLRPDAPLRSGVFLDKGGTVQGRVFSDGAVGVFVKNVLGYIGWAVSAPGLVTAGGAPHRVMVRTGPMGTSVWVDGEKAAEDLGAIPSFADFDAADLTLGKAYP